MKKKTINLKSVCLMGSLQCLLVLGLASCAQGFDSNELYTSKVTNSQLASPAESDLTFTSKVNPDGTESIQVAWPVVSGAGGYQCSAYIVDDPANPVEIFNQVVDGTSFLFDKQEDTKYEVSVQTLGDESLGNTDAASATVCAYSTLLTAQVIPAGTDIVEFVKANMVDQDTEQAFELEGGATYEINSELDFGTNQVTFRGDKANRPIVKFGIDGVIRTSAGLKIKFINFDCGEQGSKSVVECSTNPPLSLTGPKGPSSKAYYLSAPIIFQECFFKDVACSLFSVGRCTWAIEDVRIDNCIVQLKNDGSRKSDGAVINGYSEFYYNDVADSWSGGGIKSITVRNSTIYNLYDDAKNCRMVRFNNKDLSKVFLTNTGSATFENNTFIRTFSNKEFGNNTPNNADYTITFNGNICYDCYRLQKFIQGNCKLNIDITSNTIWGVKNPVDGTDKTRCATEENPQFAGDITQPLDLTQPNGGVNFRAGGPISSTIGDPRWRE